MVLYLSIQLRCQNKNKTKMFLKRHNVAQFSLIGTLEHPTMKKTLQNPKSWLLNEWNHSPKPSNYEITSLWIKQITI